MIKKEEVINLVEENNIDELREIADNILKLERIINIALSQGKEDVVKNLLEGKDINASDKESGMTLLHYACWYGDFELVKYLVGKYADPNKKDENEKTPLSIAYERMHLNIVKYLLDIGVDIRYISRPDKHGWGPLHYACSYGNLELIESLEKLGVDISAEDQYGMTELHYACWRRKIYLVKCLVKNKANINKKNRDEWTALDYACWNGDLEIAQFLVEHGADINKKDKDGKTPLCIAYEKNHPDVIKYLVCNGADINAEDKNGRIPLHYACSIRDFELVKYLVEHGADINKEDKNGETALHESVKSKNFDLVKYLVDKGADIDKHGNTALQIAKRAGSNNMVEYLKFIIDEKENISRNTEIYEKNKTGKIIQIVLGVLMFSDLKKASKIFNQYKEQEVIPKGIKRAEVVYKHGRYILILRKSNKFYEKVYKRYECTMEDNGKCRFTEIKKNNKRNIILKILRIVPKYIKKTGRNIMMIKQPVKVYIPEENVNSPIKGIHI